MSKLYECSFCGNDWTIEEGFVLKTMQCAGCQEWDDTKEQRDKEWKERMEWSEKHKYDKFKYCPGDPHW